MIDRVCAFCGTKETDDATGCLIESPQRLNVVSVCICDECVEICWGIVLKDRHEHKETQ